MSSTRRQPSRQAKQGGALANITNIQRSTTTSKAQKRNSAEIDQNPADQPKPKKAKISPTQSLDYSPARCDYRQVADGMDIDDPIPEVEEPHENQELVSISGLPEEIVETFLALKENEMRFREERDRSSLLGEVQHEVTPNMRCILVDWLVEVAEEYRLSPQTLFLAIDYLDRFLITRTVTKQMLQLIGVSCMLIASKYEEIYPPTIDDFVFITDNTYPRETIIQCEREILVALEFKLTVATPFHFLRKYLHIIAPNNTFVHNLSRYILELTLSDYNFVRYLPSHLALAVITTALYSVNTHIDDLPTLSKLTSLSFQTIEGPMREVYGALVNAPTRAHRAVVEKYSVAKYESVANFRGPKLFAQ